MIRFVSVDLQNDFTGERPCTRFVHSTLVPALRASGAIVAEIVSDYRPPLPDRESRSCRPGTWGFESVVPDDVKDPRVWVKAQQSPVWVREHGGDASQEPGPPYPDPAAFDAWIRDVVGPVDAEVVLIGLTLDCCVLCAAQELRWRGYRPRVLAEATDTYAGSPDEKQALLYGPPLKYWAGVVTWDELALA